MTVLRSAAHWGAFRMRVEGGRLVGVEPFEHDPHPTELISVWPEMVTSPLRVAKPSIRKGWLEGDGGARRGEDGYVEVSWDVALDRVASEINRIRRDHGNAAIFGGSYGWASAGRVHHARTLLHRFLNTIGGFTSQTTNYSFGAAMVLLPHILGNHSAVSSTATTWKSVAESCDVLLAFGGVPQKNWEVLSGGFGAHSYRGHMCTLADRGLRMINISPFRGDLINGPTVEWLPLRPNTDTALMLALIRELIKNGQIDRAFLDRYTSGFDAFEAYLCGAVDGIDKDAVWASTITGINAQVIANLAGDLPGKRVMCAATWSLQRARHGEQPFWALIALAAALGQIGLPGGGFAFGYGSMNGIGNQRYATPMSGPPVGHNPVGIEIPVARVADLLLEPGHTVFYNGKNITYPDIRMVYWAGGNPFHHHQDLNRLRRAFRRQDVVVVNEQYWTATARHADIVLPATTSVERNDIGGSSRDPFILAMHKGIEPVGDARDDYEIFTGLAERLGASETFTEGKSSDDWVRESWDRISTNLAQRGLNPPDFETFWEEGYFEMPAPEQDFVLLGDFRKDPVAHRLSTPSGRIEISSAIVAGFNDPELPGYPSWQDPEEWAGAELAHRFPIHLLTPQPMRKLHSQMDASTLSRQGKVGDREVIRIHPRDATARGIGDGTVVRVFNDRGACLASAALDDDLLPGVALLPTGATYDPAADGTDLHGNPNVLTRDIGTSRLGQGCAAQSCLVEIERYVGTPPPVSAFEPPQISDG